MAEASKRTRPLSKVQKSLLARPKTQERFWSKVQKTKTCWIWTSTIKHGYGYFWLGESEERAHRLSYQMKHGRIRDGLTIDHLCRNRGCVKPSHLEEVTNKVNILRGVGPSAKNSMKTSCLRGHPFDEINTRWRRDGRGRDCRLCWNLAYRMKILRKEKAK